MKYAPYVLAALFVVGMVAYMYNNQRSDLPMKIITVGGKEVEVEVASTDAQREQGLSGRTSLDAGHGMLFIFDPARTVGFWMKDMHFSIDMIFADEQGTVVTIYENVSPLSYSGKQPPERFLSRVPVRYVLEVPAGYVQGQGIAIGQKIVVQ